MGRRGRNGFSLIEILTVLALASVIAIKVGMILEMRARTDTKQSARLVVEDQARRVMEQIAYSVMGATRERLMPSPESPLYSDELRYQIVLGVENGEVVWDDPEWLGLDEPDAQIVWKKMPDAAERSVVWCNNVRELLEGELPNGVDDNGNGLIDEKGLTFTLEGNRVTARLSLERRDESGSSIVHTIETVITCRN